MLNNSINELKSVLALADLHGAKLPKEVDAAARHAVDLRIEPATLGSVVDQLLDKVGDPKGFDAALPDALDELARGDAAKKIGHDLIARAQLKARKMMGSEAERIVDAIAQKMQPYVDTLNEKAGILPLTFSPTNLDNLTPAQFSAWKDCEPAAAHLESAAMVLSWMFGLRPDETLSHVVVRRLPLVEPDDLEYPDAFAVIDGIAGIRTLGGDLAPHSKDTATFWPARAAHAGCTFRIATPTEARARADRLRAACIQPKAKERANA